MLFLFQFIKQNICFHKKMATMSLCFIYLALSLVIGFNGEEEFPKDGEVLVLTKENFDKAIKSNNNLLVMFCKFPVFYFF